MTSVPLHPALVHLPLGLAFVLPVISAVACWALWKGRLPRGAWVLVAGLQAMLLAGGLVAMNTGQREEDRVESRVPDAAISRHEEYAERFVWAAGATLGLAALVLVSRRPSVSRTLMLGSVAGTLAVAAAGIQVGHAGGQLVYQHDAAAAYAPQPARDGGQISAIPPERRHQALTPKRDDDGDR